MAKKKSYRGGGRTAAAMAGRRAASAPRQRAISRYKPPPAPTRPPAGATPLRQWKGATGGKVMNETKPN